MNKRQTLQQLNDKLKKLNEQKTSLSNIGKVVVGGGIYNAKDISKQIPIQATGKNGHSYFDNKDIKPSNDQMHQALLNLKKKQRHKQLVEEGYSINEKIQPELSEEQQDNMYSGIQYELFDRENPHFKKLFDADFFYNINESGSEDELQKEQREEVERLYNIKQVKQKQKVNVLSRVNQYKKEAEQQEELQRSISLKNEERETNLRRVLSGNKIAKKGILKNASGIGQKSPLKKSIKFADGDSDNLTEQGENSEQQKQEEYEDELDKIKGDQIPKWKLASEAFRAALKPNKDRSYKENSIINEAMHNRNLVQCEHCKRKFNPAAAEKHIPTCKDRQLTLKMKTPRRKKINL